MNALLAHWRKDLLSSRAELLLWATGLVLVFLFVLVGKICPTLIFSDFWTGSFTTNFGMYSRETILLRGILLILPLLLIVHIIQLDSLIDPNAFWRTRPLPRRSFLGAKLIFLALALAGVLLSNFAVRLPERIPDPLLNLTALFFEAVALATVTSRFSRMVLNVLLFEFASSVTAFALSLALGRYFNLQATFTNSAPVWLYALFFAGLLAAIVCQYLTLRTNLSRAIIFVTMTSCYLLQSK